jgi:2-polyprenyl-3-methyl-5-hydroxy-6-metoxy-1,4-benzoquinol methylase
VLGRLVPPHQPPTAGRDNGGMDAEEWNERYRASELVWSAGPNQFVEAELSGLPPGRALDLAAGEGRNAIWLARRGWQVTAVDFSQAGLDKGRILGEGLDVDWVCADATTWASDGEAYDVCLVAYLQLVADERRAAVRNGYASVRPGGTLLWISHDLSNLTDGTGGPQDASVLMTAEDVLTDLGGETFEVQRAGRVERPVPQPDGSTATAYDTLVRLVRRK